MSTLTEVEKRYLEKILDMKGGYVLDYTDAKFGEFFRQHGVKIHDSKYRKYGTSKAKKTRSFWEQEPDAVVGRVLSEMLEVYEADCDLNSRKVDERNLKKSRETVARLLGKGEDRAQEKTDESFLRQEFTVANIQNLPVEGVLVPIIENRLNEAAKALKAGAYLSVVVLCGSILEGVLLGNAQRKPALFNGSSASPKKDDGKVEKFHDWALGQLIDVAGNVGILKPDVQKFSHGLRHFRNYIHPNEQLTSGFTPDEHTAKICFQVLKAALADVAGERR